MKILGICGSHRKRENTFKALDIALTASEADTEIIQVTDLNITPCRACYHVCSTEQYSCVINDDLPTTLAKMKEADGIILASPLYSPVLVPSRLATLIERISCVYFFESMRRGYHASPLSGKPCGIITVSGGSEPIHLLKLLANVVLMLHMDLVTMNSYPYFGVWVKAPVEEDENTQYVHELGARIARKIRTQYGQDF
jgi:multimeric flavodoxin WrbA